MKTTKVARGGVDPAVNGQAEQNGSAWKKLSVQDVVEQTYGYVEIPIQSTSALLQNRPTEQTLNLLVGIRTGEVATKGGNKNINPEEHFLGSIHFIGDQRPKTVDELHAKPWRYGVPATAFKNALIRMMSFHDTASFNEGRGLLYVEANWRDLVEIRTPEQTPPVMDTRLGRNKSMGKSTLDPRFRAIFDEWSAKIRVRYSARHFTAKMIVEAFAHAGVSHGIGSCRPLGENSTGSLGTWKVVYEGLRAMEPRTLTIEEEKAAKKAGKK